MSFFYKRYTKSFILKKKLIQVFKNINNTNKLNRGKINYLSRQPLGFKEEKIRLTLFLNLPSFHKFSYRRHFNQYRDFKRSYRYKKALRYKLYKKSDSGFKLNLQHLNFNEVYKHQSFSISSRKHTLNDLSFVFYIFNL